MFIIAIRQCLGDLRAEFSLRKSRRRLVRKSLSSAVMLLERREFLSATGSLAGVPVVLPDIQLSASSVIKPHATAAPSGFRPSQIRQAYGMNSLPFPTGITGDGSGQTIAIVDAYDAPNIISDLKAFDTYFGLTDPPSFKVLNQTGGTTRPGTDPAGKGNSWAIEISLDVEWAHVMAPKANIILFEANSSSTLDLYTAIDTARNTAGVAVVSMSFGTNGEFSQETSLDSYFVTPAGHTGVTFVASTGDNGAPGGYPAYSPNVVAVGGSTLYTDASGNYQQELGWSGSGGGISFYEPKPAYQSKVTQSTSRRTIPDIAMDADPASGVPVYDTWDFGTTTPWLTVGGTSLAAPLFAGVVAVADQGRTLQNKGTLDGPSQTLPALYQFLTGVYHDVTSGSNGYSAGIGYDLVTGLGTSRASFLIPSLVSFSGTSNTRIAYAKVTPPAGLKFNKMFDTGSDSAGSSAGNSTSLVASGSTSAVRNLSLWAVGRGRRSDLLPSA